MVAARLADLRRRMAAACERVGRDPAEVVLVGASKRQPLERLRQARDAGLEVFGENQVPEAEAHRRELEAAGEQPAIAWHLIGPLQSNKAKRAAALFDVFHAIDRPKIARVLDRHLGDLGRRAPAFLEINLGDEPSKHGFSPRQLAATVRPLAELEHLRLAGLMAIPPRSATAEDSRPWFRRLADLRRELGEQPEWADRLTALSMGMSRDFEIAIEEGATHIRLGTVLFGSRTS
ncbi:MAG: YggS family pyridoxal phosphate-dependent enzyme [Acidobacteriota bacterium]